jgi:hypothetical protein
MPVAPISFSVITATNPSMGEVTVLKYPSGRPCLPFVEGDGDLFQIV